MAAAVETRLSRKTFEGNEPGRRTQANGTSPPGSLRGPGRIQVQGQRRVLRHACNNLVLSSASFLHADQTFDTFAKRNLLPFTLFESLDAFRMNFKI